MCVRVCGCGCGCVGVGVGVDVKLLYSKTYLKKFMPINASEISS